MVNYPQEDLRLTQISIGYALDAIGLRYGCERKQNWSDDTYRIQINGAILLSVQSSKPKADIPDVPVVDVVNQVLLNQYLLLRAVSLLLPSSLGVQVDLVDAMFNTGRLLKKFPQNAKEPA